MQSYTTFSLNNTIVMNYDAAKEFINNHRPSIKGITVNKKYCILLLKEVKPSNIKLHPMQIIPWGSIRLFCIKWQRNVKIFYNSKLLKDYLTAKDDKIVYNINKELRR